MKESGITHDIKHREDKNAVATVGAAIGQLKRAIKRRREQHGGTWYDQLEAAVKGFNATPHGATDAPPADMNDDQIFSAQVRATELTADNMRQISQRQTKLKKDGGFRAYIPNHKGLKRRADDANWSTEIHRVGRFTAPGIVEDSKGVQFLTKLVKPVPLDSSRQVAAEAPRSKASLTESLRPYANTLRELIGDGMTKDPAMRALKKKRANFSSALNATNFSFMAFVTAFPDIFRRSGNRILPA